MSAGFAARFAPPENAPLNPLGSILDRIGRTPLVRLGQIATGLSVPVLGKCEFLNPGGSIKDRIAKAVVDDPKASGLLRPGMTLVEATAGNTGIGLTLVAAVRGSRLVSLMPEKLSADKRVGLQTVGAEVVVTANAPPHDPRNLCRVAERLADENGWLLAAHFDHPANPRTYEMPTGPEIFEQRAGRGVCLWDRDRRDDQWRRAVPQSPGAGVRVVLADPVGSRLAYLIGSRHPDFDSGYQVEGIGGSELPSVLDLSVIDEAERVTDEESFTMTRRLVREEGMLVGC